MKFCEKNVLCEKGDEITRFDGMLLSVQNNNACFFLCGKGSKHHGEKSAKCKNQKCAKYVGIKSA